MTDEQILTALDFDHEVEWELVDDDGAHIAFGHRQAPDVLFWVASRTGAATRILHEGHEFARFGPVWLAAGNTLTTKLGV